METLDTHSTEMSESDLLRGLRAGDDRCFELLVRQCGGRLLAVARRFMVNEDDAQDAVQDAFLSACKAIDRFDGRSQVATWLHRIVVNACLVKLRGRGNKSEQSIERLLPGYKDDGHQLEPAVEWRPCGETLVEREEIRHFVRDAVNTLPELYREVVLLRDIEGLNTEETADLLGTTKIVVKTRLHRGRQALRTLLDARFRGDAL